ncbi:DUF1826 domain-containing protein [Acetobacteraceae bacterium KSS8]|uniref:DUF1826 domain-containing protein n=1 Tax=Endosaccharibacter trunci TaxID=2812733 RepID=A0ABT1W5P8_9PROT|nr:DUF1826 domain-containing protein [Acetobacteraceae bacterium KSS8]
MSSFLRVESAPDLSPPPPGVSPRARVVAGADPAVLLDIVRPDVGLAIWARDPHPHWASDVASLAPSAARTPLIVSGAPSVLGRDLARALPNGCPSWFEQEVSALAALLADLAAASRLRARFGAFIDDGSVQEIRLCCRYGGGGLCWRHPALHDVASGGEADPFSVLILKGAQSSIRRRRALRLLPDPNGAAAGPVLLIEPETGASS